MREGKQVDEEAGSLTLPPSTHASRFSSPGQGSAAGEMLASVVSTFFSHDGQHSFNLDMDELRSGLSKTGVWGLGFGGWGLGVQGWD